MTRILRKLKRLMKAQINALRLGFFFPRFSAFKMPEKVRVGGRTIRLHHPPEYGSTCDFLGCCVLNVYGLSERLSDLKSILDIGANVGFFSIAARSRYPGATIHAYEPNPRTLPFLHSNVEQLGVTIYPEAVGAEAHQVSVIDTGDCNGATTVEDSAGAVMQVGLDRAIARIGGVVDLLKLDCEGAEWEMLRSPALWQHVRNVRMEYHLSGAQRVQDVEDALSRLGFEVIYVDADGTMGTVWAVSQNRN
jgi:FkbM family methyltransferase